MRNDFFRRLSRYRPVDSGGRVLNTLGHRVADKQAFLRDYKFTIAFENESHPGYTTEKIVEPMLAASIPIYWGDPEVARHFDMDGIIACRDEGELRAAITDADAAGFESCLSARLANAAIAERFADPLSLAAAALRVG